MFRVEPNSGPNEIYLIAPDLVKDGIYTRDMRSNQYIDHILQGQVAGRL